VAEGTVLVRRSSLGDVVLLGAITASAPRPVTVVTDAPYVELAARLRGVSAAVAFGDHGSVRGRVVDLQGSLATRRAFPGAVRLHKRSLRRRLWLWWGIGEGRPAVPEIYAEAAGVPAWRPPWFDLPSATRDTLVLVPGAAHGPKRPQANSLIAAAEAWNGPVVVLGGPGEDAVVQAVASRIGGAEPLVERGFDETLKVFARAAVCVSGDTGLMHLAAATGTPVVTLFGPTHPADGFGCHKGVIVQNDLSCRPCALHRVNRCAMGDHACMDIDGHRIREAMRAAMQGA
jgi:hypothetical protein